MKLTTGLEHHKPCPPKIKGLGITQVGAATRWKATGYVDGMGWVEALIPETSEDLAQIERRTLRGEVDASASFGDHRAEVNEGRGDEDDDEDTGA